MAFYLLIRTYRDTARQSQRRARLRTSRHLIRLPAFARVMSAAGVLATVMLAAGMAFLMVMAAGGIRVKGQASGSQLLHCRQGVAGYTGIELDSSLSQSGAGAGADAAADELFSAQTVQEASQCAVTAAQYRNHFRADHLSIFHFRHEELPAVSEMSEDLSIFIGYRNFHCI